MKTVFRPKALGHIIAIVLTIFFTLLCIVAFVLGAIEYNIWLMAIGFPTSAFLSLTLFKVIGYRVIISETYISARKMHPKISKTKRANFTIGKYSRDLEIVKFEEVVSTDWKFERYHGGRASVSFIFLVFKLRDGKTKKIDTKPFTKKQIEKIEELLQAKIVNFKKRKVVK